MKICSDLLTVQDSSYLFDEKMVGKFLEGEMNLYYNFHLIIQTARVCGSNDGRTALGVVWYLTILSHAGNSERVEIINVSVRSAMITVRAPVSCCENVQGSETVSALK